MTVVARHLTIKGRVQGVFFRGWTVDTARDLGLSGWVRNRSNGDVEAVVQGEQSAVERFIELARRGPSAARVQDIEAHDEPVGDLTGFEQRSTI